MSPGPASAQANGRGFCLWAAVVPHVFGRYSGSRAAAPNNAAREAGRQGRGAKAREGPTPLLCSTHSFALRHEAKADTRRTDSPLSELCFEWQGEAFTTTDALGEVSSHVCALPLREDTTRPRERHTPARGRSHIHTRFRTTPTKAGGVVRCSCSPHNTVVGGFVLCVASTRQSRTEGTAFLWPTDDCGSTLGGLQQPGNPLGRFAPPGFATCARGLCGFARAGSLR